MAVIKPIKAMQFTEKAGPIETCVCPPYDIISEKERAELIEKNEYNLVRLELPEGENKYREAAVTLDAWLKEGIITRDEKPGIFVYREAFEVEGTAYALTGLVCCVELCDFSEKVVLPHEETLTKAKTDRFNLMHETGCNFSSIYSLYNDESGAIKEEIAKATSGEPMYNFTDDEGVTHILWKIECEKSIARIVDTLADKQLFIADGHHRYETALNYRNYCRTSDVKIDGEFVDDVMMTIVDMDDSGLVVFPTHRLIVDKEVDKKIIAQKCEKDFSSAILPLSDLKASLKRGEDGKTFALYTGGEDFLLLKLKDGAQRIIDGRSEAYSDLDVSVLHSFILENALGIDKENMANQVNLRYTRSMDEAIQSVQLGKANAAFLINATKVSQIKAVALAGDKMPQKSTYFYPKLKTGLVMNMLKK